MNINELQILFQQKIQDINPIFGLQDRPDTFTITNYLNKAIDVYLDRYLSLPTFEQRLIAIDQNIDELSKLIDRSKTLSFAKPPTMLNWGTRSIRYRMPEDCLIPISLTANVTRSEVLPMTTQKQFVEFVSRKQAERLVSDTSNKVIYPKPVVFFEDQFYLIIVGDAFTTAITAGEFVYLRKPSKLSYDYAEITGLGTISISAIPSNTYFKALTTLYYISGNYESGSKILRYQPYPNVVSIDNEPIKVGYPWGYTDTPEFPDYLHNKLVDLAVQLFIDEAKLKLVQKQTSIVPD
jgi:hypothetical protein